MMARVGAEKGLKEDDHSSGKVEQRGNKLMVHGNRQEVLGSRAHAGSGHL